MRRKADEELMNHRNYYTALRFQDRNDLHLTLHYYKNLAPKDLAILIMETENKFHQASDKHQFPLVLDRVDWFGYRKDIRVLRPPVDSFDKDKMVANMTIWPPWVTQYTPKSWTPHVSCDDKSLNLIVNGLAIMKGKVEIVSWAIY